MVKLVPLPPPSSSTTPPPSPPPQFSLPTVNFSYNFSPPPPPCILLYPPLYFPPPPLLPYSGGVFPVYSGELYADNVYPCHNIGDQYSYYVEGPVNFVGVGDSGLRVGGDTGDSGVSERTRRWPVKGKRVGGGSKGAAVRFRDKYDCNGKEIEMGFTTVMIKNIPNKLRKELMEQVDQHCREENTTAEDGVRSSYDFLYLPFDFDRKGNLGYAFINFTSVEAASRFCSNWNGKGWDLYGSPKIRSITRARLQGKDVYERRFEQTVFNCHTDEYLPVIFRPPRDGSNSDLTRMIPIGTRARENNPGRRCSRKPTINNAPPRLR